MSKSTYTLFAFAVLTLLLLACGEGSAATPEQVPPGPGSSGQQESEADLRVAPPSARFNTPPVALATTLSISAVHEIPEPLEEPGGIGSSLDPPSPELFELAGLRLNRFVLSRGVENREPIEARDRFLAEPSPLYAFVDAANASEEDTLVVITFERPDGVSVGHVELEIPANAPRWRTWAYSRMIQQPGEWTAFARTAEGDLLGSHSFRIDD